MGPPHVVGSPPRRHPGVAPVPLEEVLDALARRAKRVEGRTIGLEAPERLGHVGDDGGRDRRQGLAEGGRQPSLVELTGELRLAQLDEEIDERAVAVLTELEERPVDGPPVRRGRREDLAAIADRLGQALSRQGRAGRALKEERLADSPAGDEQPFAHEPAALDGTESRAQRQVVTGAVLVATTQLEPGVAEPVLVLAEQQVPLDAFRGIAVGLEAMRRGLAVEQER